MTAKNTPAAPPAEPTVEELEQRLADTQPKLQAAREAGGLKDRLAQVMDIITEMRATLDEATTHAEAADSDAITLTWGAVLEQASAVCKLINPPAPVTTRTRSSNGSLRPLVKTYLTE